MGANGAEGSTGSPSLADAALLALALRGPSSPAEVALAIGATAARRAALERDLEALAQAGLVERCGDRRPARFALRPEGRVRCRDVVAGEAAALCADLDASYTPFADLNRHVKTLLYRWQVRGEGAAALPNDHADARYDAVVLGELEVAARGAGELLEPLIAKRARYGAYVARMGEALAAARRGDRARVAGIRSDSFHGAWWELHADLLLLLGRPRADDET